MTPLLQEAALAGGLLVLLLAALELGYRAGVREARDTHPVAGTQVGTVQGAILGLLGLLLAFSFAAAGTRFLERQDLITQEANAIGTAYLRADLLDGPHRAELRTALRGYTEHRISASRTLHQDTLGTTVTAEVERLHAEIWRAASSGVADRPALALAVLAPVNDVIDLHATRVAAAQKHVPLPVLALLVACSLLSIAVIGYGNGLAGERSVPLAAPLAMLIGFALCVTIDLDHPRAGVIRLNDAPLANLKFDAP